jgi:eukaryotic-like serine/threonine-protein kinase
MTHISERSIFIEAIEFDDIDQRRAYVEQHCANNPSLQAAIEQLLAAHDAPDHIVDRAVVGEPLYVDGLPMGDESANTPTATDHVGTVIGSFRLMEQIGEGGFGLVFVAQQEHPVKRKVALKIIKPGTGSKEVVARFELERQALAMMDHPNIASVFDAGVTEDGRPYFVMELVRGLPITEYCDNYQLSLEDRVRLFQDVCAAVQHAHQKGVIHRDLKPSNVMVTLHDDRAVVKVIDFGVAKAMGDNMTETTIYTRFYSMIGTPLYMSPEQAQMSGLDVDTRSDIYSLGVMLYELLIGTTPFERERLNSVGFDEMRMIIREEDPPMPSNRISTLGNRLPTVVEARRTQPNRLQSAIRGDLDWIVMKSLEKDRNRRYESAAALASDLRRFLDHEPIDARPPSTAYQLTKFARRHRKPLLTMGMIATSLLLGTIVSLWQMMAAIGERDEKEFALQKALIAEKQATAARQEVEQFASRLTQANLLLTSGQANAEQELWSAALSDFTQAAELQPSYYLPWVLRGQFYARLNMWNEAADDFQQALALGAPVDAPQWFGVTALFVVTNRDSAVTQLQNAYLNSLNDSRTKTEWNMLRGVLIAPTSDSANQLSELAESWYELQLQGRPPKRPFDEFFRGRPGPQGGPPPRNFPIEHGQPNHVPLFESQFICGLAYLREGYNQEAAKRFRLAFGAPDWHARGIVEAPLAIAYHRLEREQEAASAFKRSKQQMQSWIADAASAHADSRKLPWFSLVESLALYQEAAIELQHTLEDIRPQIESLNAAGLAKLNASAN